MGVKDGGKLGNHQWCNWPFSKHHGHPWPFVKGGANGSMAICHGGHSWPFIDGGDGPLLPFVNCGCGWSWLFIDPGGGHLSMVLMGSRGRLSILVMGTVDIIGHDRSLSILEVGPHGQSWMVVVGAHCVSWQL